MSARKSTSTGRRAKKIPDALVVAFPGNWRADASPGAHLATWGPRGDLTPLRAVEVVLIERGDLIARFTLHVLLERGLGFYLRGCRLVRWGPGERVFLPQRSTSIKMITSPDDDGEFAVIGTRTYYADLLKFDTNRGAKAFEEAALSAARFAVARHRGEQPEGSAAPTGDGTASENEVPF